VRTEVGAEFARCRRAVPWFAGDLVAQVTQGPGEQPGDVHLGDAEAQQFLQRTADVDLAPWKRTRYPWDEASAGTRTRNENASPQRRHAPERGNRLGVAG
jgi:hypothetical protein